MELRLASGSNFSEIRYHCADDWSNWLAWSEGGYRLLTVATGACPSLPHSSDQCQPIDKQRCTGKATPTPVQPPRAVSLIFTSRRFYDIYSGKFTPQVAMFAHGTYM